LFYFYCHIPSPIIDRDGFCIDGFTVINIGVRAHQRVSDRSPVLLQHRYGLGDHALGLHLVRAPRFAGDAVLH